MSFYPITFECLIDYFGVGTNRKVWYKVVFLPNEVARTLPLSLHPRLRVDGEIADVPVEGAWMPTGDGRHYFIVAPRVLKDGKCAVGDRVEMRFRISDQNAVNVPLSLEAALSNSSKARSAWDLLTAGKRRGLTHPIHAAKTEKTQTKRTAEVIDFLLTKM